jgi:hypothetical protein
MDHALLAAGKPAAAYPCNRLVDTLPAAGPKTCVPLPFMLYSGVTALRNPGATGTQTAHEYETSLEKE